MISSAGLHAPKTWDGLDITDSTWRTHVAYQDYFIQRNKGGELNLTIPPFNLVKSCGNPGHWGRLQPKLIKGSVLRGVEVQHVPMIQNGKKDIENFVEWMRLRKLPGSHGEVFSEENLPSLFDSPEQIVDPDYPTVET